MISCKQGDFTLAVRFKQNRTRCKQIGRIFTGQSEKYPPVKLKARKSRMEYLLRLAARVVVAEGGGVSSTGVRDPGRMVIGLLGLASLLSFPSFTIWLFFGGSAPIWQF